MSSFLVRPLPESAYDLESIQKYRDLCDRSLHQLEATQPGVHFQLELTQARNNRHFTDGIYYLINNDPAADFFCHANVNTFNREMNLRVGRLSEQDAPGGGTVYRGGVIRMQDQCALTRSISEAELGGRPCQDGAVDPLVVKAARNPDLISLQIFVNQCEEAYQKHNFQVLGETQGVELHWDQIGVNREEALPGTYQILFEDQETQFICRAEFDLSQGLMLLSAPGKQEAYQTMDTCDQAEALEVPWLDSCIEKTPQDEKLQKLQSGGLGAMLAALAAYVSVKGTGMGLAKFLFPLAEGIGWQGGMARFSRWRLPLFHSLRPGLNQSVFRFVNAQGESVGLLQRLFAKPGTVTLQEQAYLSRIDRLNMAARTPGAPWHRSAGWLKSLGHAAGPAYLIGLLYDGMAAMFVDRHHKARQVGTTAVTLGSLSALTLAEHRLMQAQLAKGLAPRSLLASIPKGAGVARVANRLLWVAAFDLGMRYLAVGNDYDAWVNERVTEEIYRQDKVYDYVPDWEDLDFVEDVAFGWTKPIRGTARWLAPAAMEWAVSMDHSDIEARIRRQDIQDSLDIKKGMKEMLLTLALNPNYDQEAKSGQIPAAFDFSIFTHSPPEAPAYASMLATFVETMGFEKTQEMMGVSESEMEAALLKVWRQNFQSQAAFIVMVEGAQNDWARKLFTAEGLLKPGQEEALVRELFGSREQWGEYAQEMDRSLAMAD